jgi:GrpB-like predicted nucleotidyltransferase (UPF0157 family)
MLGLQRGTVRVVPYNAQWVSLFQEERKRLTDALGTLALDIQHIGSTAVPGLAAKPLLDIGIAVAAEESVAACEGHFFDRGSEQQLTHYLHMLLMSSSGWQNYLRFRDYLITHPASRDAYMQLKQALATQYANDRAAYTAAKAQFIQGILAQEV